MELRIRTLQSSSTAMRTLENCWTLLLILRRLRRGRGQAEGTRPTRRVWSERDCGYAHSSRQEASDNTLGWTTGKTESEHDLLRECSRVTKQRTMCCVCARLDSEHGTRHQRLESQEVVSDIHSRRDQRVLPRGRGRIMLWSHRLSGWNSRPLWGNRPLYFGDVGDFMTERLEEQSFDRCDASTTILCKL